MKFRSAELLKKHNIRLKKALGQNLLLDPNINRKMVEAAGIDRDDSVFEVGAGAGDLTSLLADHAREVLGVEIDYGLEKLLVERFGENPRIKIFIGDILNHTVTEMVERFLPEPGTLKMVSNVPYYITSPIIMHFLESETKFASLTLMVQKEVAERIVAGSGGKDYGILSIACGLYSNPYIVRTVSPTCFKPRPKVDSAIVHMPIKADCGLDVEQRRLFFKIVRTAFGQRRKKIINTLASLMGSALPAKEETIELLERCEIPPDNRPETVSIQRFIRLAEAAYEILSQSD
jgi:16S rRNA (adenine1518-N6/adenine1519-N6)-dimethyltransferase